MGEGSFQPPVRQPDQPRGFCCVGLEDSAGLDSAPYLKARAQSQWTSGLPLPVLHSYHLIPSQSLLHSGPHFSLCLVGRMGWMGSLPILRVSSRGSYADTASPGTWGLWAWLVKAEAGDLEEI